ncbi:unnamed protein product [Adineta ricciae]|uniref:DFDF domain-containing protein n=1 Tax=Adineta ricciae TaxID=249248 RepID=A0A814UZ80_ADIRI|nr:unnamed protein product [Adineta ricciae]CAF1180441.1 unnamed protein product [Adineta ricciae]
MSRDFIGSKISIITKSQCRYVGTIIGIDAQSSSIVLGSAKCYGTENRAGHVTNGHTPGTVLPIVHFANSDIDDLKIVDEESTPETLQGQSQSMSTASTQQASIHDDPAIVSAVVGASNKVNPSNLSVSNRLIHNLQHMNLSDKPSTTLSKNDGEIGASWSSLLSSSEFERNNSKVASRQQSDHKSKFFDDFISNNNDTNNRPIQSQVFRSYQRSSNTNATQTARDNGQHFNGRYEDNGLPARQPFFSNDRPYPQSQQHQNRYQNGHQQRHFHNNRRPQMPNHQRRGGSNMGGGNRETFQNNANDYDADFDFETSNQKFNKLTNEDEVKEQTDLILKADVDTDHSVLYDKKKSFFDNLVISEPSDPSAPRTHNRSKNSDTFGSDAYQRSNPRPNGYGYRRFNNNYRQHNNNNNGYHQRY